jgi:hypothetical protein
MRLGLRTCFLPPYHPQDHLPFELQWYITLSCQSMHIAYLYEVSRYWTRRAPDHNFSRLHVAQKRDRLQGGLHFVGAVKPRHHHMFLDDDPGGSAPDLKASCDLVNSRGAPGSLPRGSFSPQARSESGGGGGTVGGDLKTQETVKLSKYGSAICAFNRRACHVHPGRSCPCACCDNVPDFLLGRQIMIQKHRPRQAAEAHPAIRLCSNMASYYCRATRVKYDELALRMRRIDQLKTVLMALENQQLLAVRSSSGSSITQAAKLRASTAAEASMTCRAKVGSPKCPCMMRPALGQCTDGSASARSESLTDCK